MLFSHLATTSEQVAGAPARNEKIAILAAAIGELDEAELAVGVAYLAGVVPQGAIGVGYASLRGRVDPAPDATLEVNDIDEAISVIAGLRGPGSVSDREQAITQLFSQATRVEQDFLSALLLGALRQGASERIMMDAIAREAGIPAAIVRRAVMFTGDIGEVAVAARNGGRASVAEFGLRLFRPVLPMLAKSAPDVAAGMELLDSAYVERKLDGARIQVHVSAGEVRVYTRNLNDVTDRLPEVVAIAQALAVESAVFDGEAIGLMPNGRPVPFQVTMGRFGTESDIEQFELSPFFFDILHLDGRDVLDEPTTVRLGLLDEVVPEKHRIPRVLTDDAAIATRFFEETVASGHEGVMLKSIDTPYQAGRRGAGWLKVKPVHTLDLVVLAVEWGSGRRQGWLSNIHLGAADGRGGFVMLGKTFKGMTDKTLEWQTKRFLELETHRKGHIVYVRPEQVVEIAFDGVQASSRYPGGMALRFARVKGYREDKPAEEADTIHAVRAVLESGGS